MKNKKGFTLIEAMFAVSIMVIFFALATNFLNQGFKSTRFGSEQEIAVSNARKVTPIMVSEIREAVASDRGDYCLDIVNSQELSFYSNIDDDEEVEKVRYFLDNNVLKKGIIKPVNNPAEYLSANEDIEEIANYVNNQSEAIFTYYDVDNNLITNPSSNKNAIRLIHISLKINVTPEIAPNDVYVEMDAQLRNLKDNL